MHDMVYRDYHCFLLCRVSTAAGAYWDHCWMCRLSMRCRGFGGLLSQKAQAVIVRVHDIVNPYGNHPVFRIPAAIPLIVKSVA
jgi:hypothetical protein